MIQQLLAAEAAVADAAEERAMHEHKARCQAEAQRDIWQALAGGRGQFSLVKFHIIRKLQTFQASA